eukprot:7381670-Prymnesium_polylepis.2
MSACADSYSPTPRRRRTASRWAGLRAPSLLYSSSTLGRAASAISSHRVSRGFGRSEGGAGRIGVRCPLGTAPSQVHRRPCRCTSRFELPRCRAPKSPTCTYLPRGRSR